MRIDGGCHCGAIRYEAEVDPGKVIICHCTDCQTLSGSAFRTVVQAMPGTFRLLAGELKVYIKTGASGTRREQTFCPNCGSPIYSAPVDRTDRVVALRVGSIRQRDLLIPSDQYWFRSAQQWLADLGAMRRRDSQPGFDATGRAGEP